MATGKPSTDTSAFSEEQRLELAALIAEAVKGGAPPDKIQPKEGPKITDDEWAAMSDRQRQSFITSVVDHRLDELARLDADADRDRKIAELQAQGAKKPEPEQAPSVWTKLQGVLWGTQEAK